MVPGPWSQTILNCSPKVKNVAFTFHTSGSSHKDLYNSPPVLHNCSGAGEDRRIKSSSFTAQDESCLSAEGSVLLVNDAVRLVIFTSYGAFAQFPKWCYGPHWCVLAISKERNIG